MTSYRHRALCNIKAFLFSKHLNGLANTEAFLPGCLGSTQRQTLSVTTQLLSTELGNNTPHPKTSVLHKVEEEAVRPCRWRAVTLDGSSMRRGLSPPPSSSSSPPIHFTVRLSWDLITFCVKYKLIDCCNTRNDQENSDLKILCSSSRLRH